MLAVALLTISCSAQATGGEVPESTLNIIDTAASFIPELNLPTLEIAYDQQGVPSVFGIKTTDVYRFTGIDLSFLQLPQAYIDWFVRSNLQHLEIEHTKNGLFLYANSQLLPSIGWNAESLDNGAELASMLGVQNAPLIHRLVPVLERLGVDVVLRFPVASGNAPGARQARGGEPAPPAGVAPMRSVSHCRAHRRSVFTSAYLPASPPCRPGGWCRPR